MKLIFFLMLITSCSTFSINDYSQTIPQIQKCWKKQDVACIEQYFGKPQERTKDSMIYSSDGSPTLKIFLNDQKIVSIFYWIVDPKYANSMSIKNLLPSTFWRLENRKNPRNKPTCRESCGSKLQQKTRSIFPYIRTRFRKKGSNHLLGWGLYEDGILILLCNVIPLGHSEYGQGCCDCS